MAILLDTLADKSSQPLSDIVPLDSTKTLPSVVASPCTMPGVLLVAIDTVVEPPASRAIVALLDWLVVNEPLVVPPCVMVIVALLALDKPASLSFSVVV